jgi:hypothetical protein
LTPAGTLTFENGGSFVWNNANTPVVPAATWADGSLCKISATASGTVNAIGVSGQNFYDFTWDTSVAGQSARTRLDLQTNTTTSVRRNFSITIPNTANASVSLCNGTNTTLTVGGNVTFATGAGQNSTKVLLNNAGGDSFLFKVAGNFSASGFLDGFGSSASTIEFNGGNQMLALPTGTNLITGGAISYQVDNSSTITLNTPVSNCNQFSVASGGTLNANTNQIAGGQNFVLNSTSVLIGNGTNQIANVNTNIFGGTLNIANNLPGSLANGTSFKLFGGVTNSGSFASIVPATPGANQVWDTSQLVPSGTLIVASSSGSTPVFGGATLLSGTNLVLSGTGGTPNTGYTVLTSTNLTTPIASWPVDGTGTFAGDGSFSYTNNNTTKASSFFIIRAP